MEEYKRPLVEDVVVITGKSPLKPIKGDFKYFSFSQNNSGGHFDRDQYVGDHVIIAARDHEDANDRAQRVGIYFGGCDSGQDCECCGDRWYSCWSDKDAMDEPLVYSKKPAEWITEHHWRGRKVVIHLADGFMETHVVKGEENYEDR